MATLASGPNNMSALYTVLSAIGVRGEYRRGDLEHLHAHQTEDRGVEQAAEEQGESAGEDDATQAGPAQKLVDREREQKDRVREPEADRQAHEYPGQHRSAALDAQP